MTTSWAPSPIAKQCITDKQLIGTDWLRSIANFWQLICVYKLDSIYSQTSANLSHSDCSQSESDHKFLWTGSLPKGDPGRKWSPQVLEIRRQ